MPKFKYILKALKILKEVKKSILNKGGFNLKKDFIKIKL